MSTSNCYKTDVRVNNPIPTICITEAENLKDSNKKFYSVTTCILNKENGLRQHHGAANRKELQTKIQKFQSSERQNSIETAIHKSLSSSNSINPGMASSCQKSENSTKSTKSLSETKPFEEPELPIKLVEDVDAAIKHFLFPYICNQITPEVDKKRTTPFLTTISELLCEKHGISKENKKFHLLVFNAYIEHSARGLFTNSHLDFVPYKQGARVRPAAPKEIKFYFDDLTKDEKNVHVSDLEYLNLLKWFKEWLQNVSPFTITSQYTKPVLILLNALLPALKKDFPNIDMSIEEIIFNSIEMLKYLNKLRKAEHQQMLMEMVAVEWEAQICPEGAISKSVVCAQIQYDKFVRSLK